MTSPAGIEGSATLPLYATMKGALRGFAKSLAREWAPHGVTVNVVSPLAYSPPWSTPSPRIPTMEARLNQRVPLGRLGDPETDVGRGVVFLVSADAGYVTGQTPRHRRRPLHEPLTMRHGCATMRAHDARRQDDRGDRGRCRPRPRGGGGSVARRWSEVRCSAQLRDMSRTVLITGATRGVGRGIAGATRAASRRPPRACRPEHRRVAEQGRAPGNARVGFRRGCRELGSEAVQTITA